MSGDKEAVDVAHEIADILSGWFPGELYVDTDLRFREVATEEVIGEGTANE